MEVYWPKQIGASCSQDCHFKWSDCNLLRRLVLKDFLCGTSAFFLLFKLVLISKSICNMWYTVWIVIYTVWKSSIVSSFLKTVHLLIPSFFSIQKLSFLKIQNYIKKPWYAGFPLSLRLVWRCRSEIPCTWDGFTRQGRRWPNWSSGWFVIGCFATGLPGHQG